MMLLRLLILFLIAIGCLPFLLLTGSESLVVEPEPEPTSPVLISTQDYEGIIFPASMIDELGLVPWIDGGDGDYWTPSEADITALESGIEAYLQENRHLFYREPFVWERLTDYRRQYVGLTRNGERYIYANFFCDADSFDYWQEQFVFVMDGGDCFFQVYYQPATDEFSNLTVNGEA